MSACDFVVDHQTWSSTVGGLPDLVPYYNWTATDILYMYEINIQHHYEMENDTKNITQDRDY